jgi:hypothetical protein
MGEVIELGVDTLADISVDKVLAGALNANLEDVLVLGIDDQGRFYIAASSGSCALNLLMAETARAEVFAQAWKD